MKMHGKKRVNELNEMISLAVLILIAKRFQHGHAPIYFSELYRALRVPSHILNSGISRLCEMGYIYPIEMFPGHSEHDRAYQAGRPLDTLTLAEFKESFDCFGNNEGSDLIARSYPTISSYQNALHRTDGVSPLSQIRARRLNGQRRLKIQSLN